MASAPNALVVLCQRVASPRKAPRAQASTEARGEGTAYNAARQSVPAVLFAQSTGFLSAGTQRRDFFSLNEAERKTAKPSNSKRQLPMRGLSGATGVTRCMGGAIGVGATYGRAGGGGGPRPQASKPRGG